MKNTILLALVLTAGILTACGSGINILPEPFTRERADGKIPVKRELIRQQVQRELAGMPEGEAEVARWQAIEADYHSCRLSSKKAADAAEEVFADCMANRGYVYMYPLDAEQLHNDIEFEMEKTPEKWQGEVVITTITASPITITSAPPIINTDTSTPDDSGGYAKYLLGIAVVGGIGAAVAGGGGGGSGGGGGGNEMMPPTPFPTTPRVSIRITPQAIMTMTMTNSRTETIRRWYYDCQNVMSPISCFNAESRIESFTIVISSPTTVIHTTAICNATEVYQRLDNVFLCRRLGRPQNFPLTRTVTNTLTLSPIITTTRTTTFATMTVTLGANAALNIGGKISYSPDMRRVVHAVMSDGFNPGFAFGESGFAFSGRYDGDNRAAGFSYDFDGIKMRTDYVRLPAKQDGNVWLDTYRFGIIPRINDKMAAFAGVDNYNNAIFAIDITGDNLHRFGIAAGDGYAVKYEFRVRL